MSGNNKISTFHHLLFYNILLISQHDYQQHHAQGPQSVKRASHKFSPYPPFSGSKSHHQGNAGKKYSGKYPSSLEGASSSGTYSGKFKNLANTVGLKFGAIAFFKYLLQTSRVKLFNTLVLTFHITCHFTANSDKVLKQVRVLGQ